MNIEAMKQALEALERSVATCFDQYAHQQVMSQPDHFINQAITSLRQAIAEAEKQDGDCQKCGGKGCVACDAREQEPVAWMFQHDETGRMTYLSNDGFHNPTMFIEMNPRYALVCSLYTHPPKHEWVGLTDTEIKRIGKLDWDSNYVGLWYDFAKAIEAKLKEKNHV